jgi:hypothetical protein
VLDLEKCNVDNPCQLYFLENIEVLNLKDNFIMDTEGVI